MKNPDKKTSEDSNSEELTNLEEQVDMILREELKNSSINYDSAKVKIFNVKSVGIQGDKRTYAYPAGITIYQNGKIFWEEKFISKLSTRITNEVSGINRVGYLFETD